MTRVIFWFQAGMRDGQKNTPSPKKIVFMAQDDRELLSVSYFKWTMQTSTWHDYLICLGQRVKLGNDVMPTI